MANNKFLEAVSALAAKNQVESFQGKELDRAPLNQNQVKDFGKLEVFEGKSKASGNPFYYIEAEGLWVFLPRDWAENASIEPGDSLVVRERNDRKSIVVEREE